MADPLEGVSPAGMIVTGADRARVAAEYEPALERILSGVIAAVVDQFSESIGLWDTW